MKKHVCLSTFLLLLMPFYNCIAQSDYSGTCGNGLIWTYSETTKTLIISGAGDMFDYDNNKKLAPWYNFRNDIQRVILGSEVYSIGNYAFNHVAMTSIIIPKSVARIGKWAFFSSDLISVIIPNGIVTLEESTFNGCDKLTEINLPNTLTTIGYKAFYRCRSLASIEIPDKVTSIGELAFWECHSLTSVTIPQSVTSIGANAFDGEAEYTPNIQTIISFIVNPFEIAGRTSYDERNHYVGAFSRKTLSNAALYVPKGTVDKYKSTNGWKDFNNIVEIGGSDNSIYTEVEINNIKYRITSDTEVEVAQKQDHYSGDIVIPETVSINNKEYKVTSIGKRAFLCCSSLKSIELPNSIIEIGEDAFHQSGIESIKLPHNLRKIGPGSFSWSNLKKIVIPEMVERICAHTFRDCCYLDTVIIPNKVTSIGDGAFNGCNLKTVVIGENVNSIGKAAFEQHGSLMNIYTLNRTPPVLNVEDNDYHTIFVSDEKFSFNDYLYKSTLWVPESSLEEYKKYKYYNWGKFENIQTFDPNTFDLTTLGIKTTTNDEEEVNRYSLDGRKLLAPTKGVNIIKMKDGTVKKVLIK